MEHDDHNPVRAMDEGFELTAEDWEQMKAAPPAKPVDYSGWLLPERKPAPEPTP